MDIEKILKGLSEEDFRIVIDKILPAIADGQPIDFSTILSSLSKEGQEAITPLVTDSAATDKLMIDGVEQNTTAADINKNWADYLTSEEGAKRVQDMKDAKFAAEVTGALQQGVGFIGALADLKFSKKQIEAAEKGLSKLRRPALPNVSGIDNALEQEIYRAQMGTMDSHRALDPAKAQLREQQVADQQVAQSVSGGQAGIYGGLAQASATRRNRGARELVPMADTVRAREQGNLNNLLQLRQYQDRARFDQQSNNAGILENRFNMDTNIYGNLLATGIENRRDSWRNMGNSLAGIGGQLSPSLQRMVGQGNFNGINPWRTNNIGMHKAPYDPTANFDVWNASSSISNNLGIFG